MALSPPASVPAPTRRTGFVLTLACLAQFMVVLDVSIVNVALRAIHDDLHFSDTGLQWVVNAYAITFAGFLLLGGRAADLFGQRRVFVAGLTVFGLASLAGGLAPNSGALVAARAVQGLGGAILAPATLTILTTTFSGPALPRALGIWGGVAGAGGAAGSVLGGVIVNYLNWRWILLINVPLAVVGVFAARSLLAAGRPTTATGERRHLDLAGAITVTGGLSVLVYGIVSTDAHPWGSARTLVTVAIAVALLVAFLVIESRLSAAPLMPLRIFRARSLSVANVVLLLIGATTFAMWYFQSLYLQEVHGYSPLRTGMAFLPLAAAIMVASQVGVRLVPRFGIRAVCAFAGLLMAGGFLWMAQIDATTGYVSSVLGPGLLATAAIGLLFAPLSGAATAGVARSEAGLASGLVNTSRQMGGALGLAALGTVAARHTTDLVTGGTARAAAQAAGYAHAFGVAAVLALVAGLAALLLPGRVRPPAPPDLGTVPGVEDVTPATA